MSASVLAPAEPSGPYVIRAVRRPGPPSLEIRGLPPDRSRALADRVRAGIHNSGYGLPTGRIAVAASVPDGGSMTGVVAPGLDLPVALAILLADPAHGHLRRPNLIAWGRLSLDGSLGRCPAPGIPDLPAGPWTGRFWRPTDHVPAPDEDAVLSIVDTDRLADAWDALIRLVERERELAPVPRPALPRT